MQRPMLVLGTEGDSVAVTERAGRQFRVSMAALGSRAATVRAGDWLLVLAGVAVEVLPADEARERTEMVDRVVGDPG